MCGVSIHFIALSDVFDGSQRMTDEKNYQILRFMHDWAWFYIDISWKMIIQSSLL